MSSIHEGHRERLRNKYMTQGKNLEPHEILEILLSFSVPRKNTNEMAHKLIHHFGDNIGNVFDADPVTLAKAGISERSATLIHLVADCFYHYTNAKFGDKTDLTMSDKRLEFCKGLLMGEVYEAVYVICLNAQNRVIGKARVQAGTLSEVKIYIRKIMEIALRTKSHSLILVHNHPGGLLMPSQQDMQTTVNVGVALKIIEVDLIDHIVVAGDKALSMRELGYLTFDKTEC